MDIENPPFILGQGGFTLGLSESRPPEKWCENVYAMVLSHTPTRSKQNHFGIRGYNRDWECLSATSFSTLEGALLFASEELGIRVASWRIFDPGRGIRLYSNPRTAPERKHSVQRKRFARLLSFYKVSI